MHSSCMLKGAAVAPPVAVLTVPKLVPPTIRGLQRSRLSSLSTLSLACTLAFGLSCAAFAQVPASSVVRASVASPEPSSGTVLTQMPEVVVTATRIETRADAQISHVVVIPRERILRHTGRSLAELLAREAGVQINQQGGPGNFTAAYVRGGNSSHVLLLVDGVRVSSATTGTPTLQALPVELIDRIEVLKGPASALYGSDAVSGVIQVFTQRGLNGFAPWAQLGVGSRGLASAQAGVAGGNDALRYSVSASALRDRGFSASNPAVPFGAFNPDRDGREQLGVQASLDAKFTPAWSARAWGLLSHQEVEYDGGAVVSDIFTRDRLQTLGAELNYQSERNGATRLTLTDSLDRTRPFNAFGPRPARFDTSEQRVVLSHERELGALGVVLVGYEHAQTQVRSTTVFAVDQRNLDAGFVSLAGQAGNHHWQAAARLDDDSQFGRASTWHLGYAWQWAPAWRWFVSSATAFKAPSFNDLYFPGFGNPNLLPERGRHWETGLAYDAALGTLRVTRFDNRVRDLIAVSGSGPNNVNRARLLGWSVDLDGESGPWAWRLRYEHLKAQDVATGRLLSRRAQDTATLGVDRTWGSWTLGADWLVTSARFDDAANRVRLPGYGVLDLQASRALTPNWTLGVRLNNATDKRYELARGYNAAPRTLMLTLRWAPSSP